MSMHEIFGNKYARARADLEAAFRDTNVPTLAGPGTRSVEAWFLGPKAENAALFEALFLEALRDHVHWRKSYRATDPRHISDEMQRSPEYLQATDSLREELLRLLAHLKKSVPFFSMRYQGHMNWDLTLPGLLGYFSTMLYNPNNVAFEGSTVTTLLEMLVGDDLCRMLGFATEEKSRPAGAPRPWGHITCDGTVANIEAMWAARNLRFYPLAVREALRREPSLSAARELRVRCANGTVSPLVDLENFAALNLLADEILDLPRRFAEDFKIAPEVLTAALEPYSLQHLGLAEFTRRYVVSGIGSPVLIVTGTRHYSFPKAAALLGLGAANLLHVPVDLEGRMDLAALESMLNDCLKQRRPVLAVVSILGSTEESAVDPLRGVLTLRDKLRGEGLDFLVHVDAAWGGYHVSLINEDSELEEPPGYLPQAPPLVAPLSAYCTTQYLAIREADSVTIDPHKSGYIPYPAGALCYRNGAMRNLVSFSAPVVYHGDTEPTVGIYGVEGSKPGAAAAAVYLSHRVIRPSKSGYGQIIGQALFSARKLYARLLCMAAPSAPFIVLPVCRLPGERVDDSEAAARQLQFIATRIVGKTNAEVLADPEACAMLAEMGPDQNIVAYAFNFRCADGSVNSELAAMNQLNTALYQALSLRPGENVDRRELIVSTTDFDTPSYGSRFIESLKQRSGVGRSTGGKITVLRSVVMDPWITETANGSFLDTLEGAYRNALREVLPRFTAAPWPNQDPVKKDAAP